MPFFFTQKNGKNKYIFTLLVGVQFYFVSVYIDTYTNNHSSTTFNKKRKQPMAVSAEDWLKIMI